MKNFFSFGKTIIPNDFATAQKAASELGQYEIAERKLSPKTFRETYAAMVAIVNFFARAYPFASIFTGLATAFMAASLFLGAGSIAEYLIFAVILILALVVLFGIETAKANFTDAFFHSKFNNEKSSPIFALFVFLSIAISALGGYLITAKVTDKTAEISAAAKVETDSVRNFYLTEIKNFDAIIAANQSDLQKKGWRKNIATENIAKAQTAKADLLSRLNETQKETESKAAKETEKNLTGGTKSAIISAAVITVFEVLFVLCVWFSFWYASGLRTENRNFNFVEIPTNYYTPNVIDTPYEIAAKHNENRNENRLNDNRNENRNENRKVGFDFLAAEKNDENRNENRSNITLSKCENCGKDYVKNHKKQRFCCDDCRKSFHGFTNYRKGK